ncbi:hypothetical protein EDD85DRAFT_831793 [Armillaria nabsnona]|nr:hypothetical protein EDD85DRAFT_831793 [Armillaria nabsnona]
MVIMNWRCLSGPICITWCSTSAFHGTSWGERCFAVGTHISTIPLFQPKGRCHSTHTGRLLSLSRQSTSSVIRMIHVPALSFPRMTGVF